MGTETNGSDNNSLRAKDLFVTLFSQSQKMMMELINKINKIDNLKEKIYSLENTLNSIELLLRSNQGNLTDFSNVIDKAHKTLIKLDAQVESLKSQLEVYESNTTNHINQLNALREDHIREIKDLSENFQTNIEEYRKRCQDCAISNSQRMVEDYKKTYSNLIRFYKYTTFVILALLVAVLAGLGIIKLEQLHILPKLLGF